MGKKVSPHSIRIGITRKWDSSWYAKGKQYKKYFLQDVRIREHLTAKYKDASLSKVEIKRSAKKVEVILHTAKPGTIIGRSGENIKKITDGLKDQFGENFTITVQEIQKPDSNAQLVAYNVSEQIARRFPFRRVCKMALEKAKESGVKGIKIQVSGRLNGVDIARVETYSYGTVPLHTLRANIDYATARCDTTYGVIGIKVWTYHGLVFKNENIF
jgi:small subunit ribosomal protein S3